MDISSSRKSDAVNILRNKYGQGNVAQIGNIMTMQAKSCIDKIGKVLGLAYTETKEIGKQIPDGMSVEDALQKSARLTQYREKYPLLFEYAIALEGLSTGMSTHAGGVVICPSNKNMEDFTALAVSDDIVITQLEMKGCEKVGLVKMDALATGTLDCIDNCLTLIHGGDIDG